jgi:hypothetical protein
VIDYTVETSLLEEMVKPDFTRRDAAERHSVLEEFVRNHPRVVQHGHINLHVHTNESYSFFENPTEAVWYAYVEDIEYFGINDHYTIAGHDEFRGACRIASLKSTYSIEAIALDEQSQSFGTRYNDPDNYGRCYLVGKGVTRPLDPGSTGSKTLATMQRSIRERNRRIVHKLNRYAAEKGVSTGLTYEEADALTPHGNTTERHVVQAFYERIATAFADLGQRAEVLEKLLEDSIDENLLNDPVVLQTALRAKLVKAGGCCFVPEDPEAFTSIENLVDLYLEYGAIPIYPLMGNPITEEEADLERLFRKMEQFRLHALEIIDYRTEIERAAEIINAADLYGYPVFVGTEHNTKKETSLVGPVAQYPDFYDYLKRSAHFVIGHQRLMELCDFGFVLPDGGRRFHDRHEGFRFFEENGERKIPPEELDELKLKSPVERKRYFGI